MKVFLSIGDLSAANYVYEIFRERPAEVSLVGITDRRLEGIGVRSVGRVSDLSVVGVAEVLPRLLTIRRIYRRAVEELKGADVLVACDAPGFNLRLIKDARAVGVKKVVYFISPQVWAWKPARAEVIARYCDHLVVILPFEVDIYGRFVGEDFKVHYVGHPLVDIVKPGTDEESFRRRLNLKGDFLNLMPGSRWGEVKRHAPILLQIVNHFRDVEFTLPTFEEFRPFLESAMPGKVRVLTEEVVPSPAYSSMFYSSMSLIASGTSSLEAALSLNPHVVFYRVNPITYLLGRMLVRVPYVSLPNLILGDEVVPEFINADVRDIKGKMEELMSREDLRQRQVERFEELREALGGEGVVERLRSLLLELISV